MLRQPIASELRTCMWRMVGLCLFTGTGNPLSYSPIHWRFYHSRRERRRQREGQLVREGGRLREEAIKGSVYDCVCVCVCVCVCDAMGETDILYREGATVSERGNKREGGRGQQ